MASTYLTRTQVAGNRSTFTQSFWFKLSNTGDQTFISTFNDSSNYNYCYLDSSSGELRLQWKKSGSVVAQKNTTRKFRDFSAWYHIVYAIDTTQASGGDRIKLYVNGVLETDFSSNTAPGQITTEVNDNGTTQYIGSVDGSQQYFDGSMSYVAQIDGTAEAPTVFGETDATTGEWKVKTTITPSVALGNNGFLILKDGNTVTDSSTNSNNFAVAGGTLTKTEDCPSNVFPIFASIYCPKSSTNAAAFLNGGTTVGGSPSDASSIASMGARSGKYYWEIKVQNATNTRSCGVVRSDSIDVHSAGIYPGGNGNASIWTVAYNMVNGYVQKNQNGTQSQQGSLATLTTGDILGVALNLTDYEIKWYKNNSLVTTTSLSADWVADGNFLLPCNRTDGNQFVQYNFGNGFFATTAIASEGTNASGIGKFEYGVPSGFTALSTKGLNL